MTEKEILDLTESLSFEQQVELQYKLSDFLREERKERFDSVLDQRTRHFAIALEDTYQEHNAGAVIRSADCFGIQDVYAIQNHNQHKVAKTIAKGSTKWVSRHLYNSEQGGTVACIQDLKAKGYRVVGTTPHSKVSLKTFDVTKPAVFVMGAEKRGISQTIHDMCDEHMTIPMHGFTESFNVSVALALILFEVTSRLRDSDVSWQLSKEDRARLLLEWTLKTIPGPGQLTKAFLSGAY